MEWPMVDSLMEGREEKKPTVASRVESKANA
jgi:hypothetical protein